MLVEKIDVYECKYCKKKYDDPEEGEKCPCMKSVFKKVQGWQCNNCDEWHKTEEAAIRCCSDVIKKKVYECPTCHHLHDEKYDAIQCCDTLKTIPGGGWKCGECGNLFFNKEDAEDCCKDENGMGVIDE